MKILHLLRLGAFVAADKRLERKEIDLRKLEKEYEEDDDVELEVRNKNITQPAKFSANIPTFDFVRKIRKHSGSGHVG
jgi:hypothetical protein